MLNKLQRKHISVIAGSAIFAFSAGALLSAPDVVGTLLTIGKNNLEQISLSNQNQSAVFSLVSKSPVERATKLEAIANGASSPDKERARYLLATDLLQTRDAQQALKLLAGLETSYPSLAPYILLQKAQAHDLLGESGKASDMRQRVLRDYPNESAAAKALYMIALPESHDEAITKFPSHPLTWEIIHKRLRENPQQPKLRVFLAKYAYHQAGIVGVLDNLGKQPNLTPAEWEIVARAYWENNQFTKAADAYAQAPVTAENLYRRARGLQVGGKEKEKAIAMYNQLVKKFPDAKETGVGFLRLAEMASNHQQANGYLDQVITKFPQQASKALFEKIKIFQGIKDQKSAEKSGELLIAKYSNSEEAAEYRWNIAQQKAKAKDYAGAWQWAQPISNHNPRSILAPRAGFWVGKWATILGRKQEAQAAYEYVLSEFPYSYYAWRSAVILGLDVGNFNSVRRLQPEIFTPPRPLPPAGSDTFKELYLLGQDNDAWLQWETEFMNKLQPTVAEQFTEGLMRLKRGENLAGIRIISQLEDREIPTEQQEYQNLSRELSYWHARYPLAYKAEIQNCSLEYQLNPLLVTALMRQESMFEPKIKSVVGATGLMQVMPSTAEWIAPQIKLDAQSIDLEDPNQNIKLGTWYLDHTHNQYNNNSMLAIASYNAGPSNVSKWLQSINKTDPDEFVENIPFNETRNYVRQVFGNYWNYLRLYNPDISAKVARYSKKHPQLPPR